MGSVFRGQGPHLHATANGGVTCILPCCDLLGGGVCPYECVCLTRYSDLPLYYLALPCDLILKSLFQKMDTFQIQHLSKKL